MTAGVLFALAAGLMWGLVFVAPLLLPDYPAALLSVGRYLAFGLIALPMAGLDRARLRELTRADWIEALKLAAIGNLLYYLLLAAAIQRAGGPLPTMVIGTLPVVIAIASNLRDARRDGRLPWLHLSPSLLLIAAGIALVNRAELEGMRAQTDVDLGPVRTRRIAGAGRGRLLDVVSAPQCRLVARQYRAEPAHLGHRAGRRDAAAGAGRPRGAARRTSADGCRLPAAARADAAAFRRADACDRAAGLVARHAVLERGEPATADRACRTADRVRNARRTGYAFALRGRWPAGATLAGVALLVIGVAWALRVRPEPIAIEPH